MFRFIHTGDLHLDSPFAGIGGAVTEAVAEALRTSTLRAWHNIVSLALEEQVDFFLVAGDAFESAARTLPGQVAFRDGLKRLSDAGIPSFVVTGNHDHEGGYIPAVAWPELAYRFSPARVEARPVMRGGREIARIYGQGYRQQFVRDNLAAKFRREPDAPFAIGLLHTQVGSTATGDYAPCTMTDLRNAGMDYWALGHVHKHGVLSAAKPVVVYCGNPQGRDPGEVEPRGCYLVTVGDDGSITPEFRVVDEVRWQLLDVSVGDLAGEEAIARAVAAAVDEARTRAGRSVVARVRLTGSGPAHALLARANAVAGIWDVARTTLGEGSPFAFIESVHDATRPEFNRAERAAADDFVGSVLRFTDELRAKVQAGPEEDVTTVDPALDALIRELWASNRGAPYLRNRRLSKADVLDVLDRAEAMVVGSLVVEG